jgi:hypothetical protein
MPKLPFDAMITAAGLDEKEARIIRAAFNGRTGCLRASKPHAKITGSDDSALEKASANYVWRMLCFDYVGWGKHACMPVTADWDIAFVLRDQHGRDGYFDLVRQETVALNATVKRFESTIPVTAQAGTMRWGRALGLVG